VAKGIRNTVGFDWSPSSKDLWFTDNGRDMLGEDVPADELNHLTKKGQHFGYPYCHAGDNLDPEFGKEKKCADYTPPEAKFGAHVAALGMRFLRHQKDPSMNGNILAALHGSWNRKVPQGYEVMQIRFNQAKAQNPENFLTGFQQGTDAWGRPVDVQELADGSILVSDDKVGAVYRLSQ
jgi:glucose/arabinose dehydrogenase